MEAPEIKGRPGGMHEAIGKSNNTSQDYGTAGLSFEVRFQKALKIDPSSLQWLAGDKAG